MQPGIGVEDFGFGQLAAQLFEQDIVFFAVQNPHAVKMPFKRAVFHKAAQHQLFEQRYRTMIKGQALLIHGQQRDGQHHITDAHGGGNGFGEGSHINNAVAGVHSLQRRNGASLMLEFAVIIVFNQITLRLFRRPVQQLGAPPHRHDGAGWELV